MDFRGLNIEKAQFEEILKAFKLHLLLVAILNRVELIFLSYLFNMMVNITILMLLELVSYRIRWLSGE